MVGHTIVGEGLPHISATAGHTIDDQWSLAPGVCLEAAERPQWPKLNSLGRPRSCDRIPSLVGDRGLVL